MSTEPRFTIKASHPDAVKVVSYFTSLCGLAGDADEKAEAIHLSRTMRAWRDAHPRSRDGRNFDAEIVDSASGNKTAASKRE